jgi:hypothetical protein
VAHFILETIRTDLDLSGIMSPYDAEQGFPPFHASMMRLNGLALVDIAAAFGFGRDAEGGTHFRGWRLAIRPRTVGFPGLGRAGARRAI